MSEQKINQPLADISKMSVPTLPSTAPELPKQNGFWSSNPVFSYLNDVYTNISQHRQSLGLTNPGTVENLTKEVNRDVFLNQHFFQGLRADLNKSFCFDPAFQTSHAFSIGGDLPPYAFSALYARENMFAQGNIDNQFSVSGKVNYGWDEHNVSKVTLQIAHGQPTMCQLEQDYNANDFSINFKTLNPSYLSGAFTGVAIGSLLQSLTKKFAVGVEATFSRQNSSLPPDSAISYFARYNAGDWIATAQVQGQGALVGTFWRKVSENVQAGLETQIAAGMRPVSTPFGAQLEPVVEGITTLGAKYEYRTAVFRGQVDTTGKTSVFLEKKIMPMLSVMFAGEIDHFKQSSKVGAGLQVETAGNEQIFLMQNGMVDANGNPIPGAAM
ncbi:uncharacterized protein CXQ87_003651 [Candidozyma duobushaemuli]|uniref:Mitochondrial import receptor subunit TOM40 n=2 Tax=Candidozyma TaxID=3303203 RepID=A0ABX8I9X2_9ASCO|nr:uncharacterized protein CXQ87_003651 [[Candida] duobushaemulonis]PVH15796.1 hypothetical protein CXQ87_003651 [[Candida] duobushaemulonis]QWU89500.1 hypothetical protein CA3LBN_003823 [[Candida] haemuloni]